MHHGMPPWHRSPYHRSRPSAHPMHQPNAAGAHARYLGGPSLLSLSFALPLSGHRRRAWRALVSVAGQSCLATSVCHATHGQHPAHHADSRLSHLLPLIARTAVRGHGAGRVFPSNSLARLGPVVVHVLVATCVMAAVRSPGFAGANRRRHRTSFPRDSPVSGRRAQLPISGPRLRGAPGVVSAVQPTTPGDPGHRLRRLRAANASRATRAGTAAVRTAGSRPVASRRPPTAVVPKAA